MFKELLRTVWTDLSGNGNNGTLINGTSYSSANGGVMVFDGVNDSVLGNTNTLNNSQSFTTITWFSANQVIAEQHLTNLKATPPTQLYVAGGKIGTRDYGSLSGGTIVPNTWYMVVCTRDSSGAGKLYINGQYIATSTLKSYSANTQFVIGTFDLSIFASLNTSWQSGQNISFIVEKIRKLWCITIKYTKNCCFFSTF